MPHQTIPDGWTQKAKYLEKTFIFSDFPAAISFMIRVAPEAQRLNHHPEWTNIYNKVMVKLTTHDAGGLTDLDYDLARVMDSVY